MYVLDLFTCSTLFLLDLLEVNLVDTICSNLLGVHFFDIVCFQLVGSPFFSTLFFFQLFSRSTVPGRYLVFVSLEISHRMPSESRLGTYLGPSYDHISKNIYLCKGWIG